MGYELLVDRAHLVEGLKAFKARRGKIRIRRGERAVLAFDGQFLSIEAFDRCAVARATGSWPGLAYVTPTTVVALSMSPPDGDPVKITCDGKRLRIGSTTIDCRWQTAAQALIDAPAVPDWLQAVGMKYRMARSQIIAGGYAMHIANAELEVEKLIKRAAKPLEPLGVNENDIRALVEGKLQARYASGKPSS